MRPQVFVTRPIPDAGLAALRGVADVTVRDAPLPPTRDELHAALQSADGLICLLADAIDADLLAAAPRLRAVANYAVGFNNIDVAAATRLGIAVGNTPDVLTDATADCAVMLLLAAARCLRAGLEDVAAGRWRTWEPTGYLGQELAGKTVGIVGLGRIGLAVARRCRGGWGMRVLYHGRRPHPDAERELGAARVNLDTLLAESDFVSLHCPLTADNRGMIGRDQFARMKPTAVFVNTARGQLVDEAALAEALQTGRIFAAGLDVTDPEPPRADNPMLRLPNLVVAPHLGSATVVARTRMADRAAANIMAALQGRPMPFPVNPEVVPRGAG
jgi:glyoxylate reductase